METESQSQKYINEQKEAPFIIKVRHCKSFSKLSHLCLREASRQNLKALAYHHLPLVGSMDVPALNIISLGFPKGLAERYKTQELDKVDPSLRKVMSATSPYWWHDIDYSKGLHSEEIGYLNSIPDDIGVGLIMPVFGPNGRNGFVALGYGHIKPDLSEEDILSLQNCCQVAHQQYCDLLQTEMPEMIRLSRREHEILSWVARGKSNGVIADIVGVSEPTVVTYLQRTYAKLGVNNRVTAALRALSIGELS